MAFQLAWLAGIFGGVVTVAALVNRFARANRHRLRRAVVLFALFAASTVAALAFASLDPRWSNGFSIASDLFAALTIANTADMLLFLIIMPATFVGLPMIAGDLAKTDVECFRLPRATFETVLTGRPEILTELAERLASRNVTLSAAREDLDDAARKTRHAIESQRIRDGIKDFFGL